MNPTPITAGGVPRRIVGFHQDTEGHWVADLECGHTQHVRHNPPWQNRLWVTTEEGRHRFLGAPLKCILCRDAQQSLSPPLPRAEREQLVEEAGG